MGREYARCLENGFEVERGRGALSKQGGNWDSGKQGGNKYKSCPSAFHLRSTIGAASEAKPAAVATTCASTCTQRVQGAGCSVWGVGF